MQHETTYFYRLDLNHLLTINKFTEYLFREERQFEYIYTQ